MNKKEAIKMAMYAVEIEIEYWKERARYWDEEAEPDMFENAVNQIDDWRKAREELAEMLRKMRNKGA